jgi:hypothetical protein
MGIFFSPKQRQVYILLVFSITQNAYGQAVNNFRCIDPFTINVAGHNAMIQNQLFDWSIGELSTRTFFGKAVFIISLGFLQSSYHPLLVYNNIDSFAFQIKIGPNPFSNYIIIQCEQDQLIINGIQLLDFQGKILYRLNGDYSGHQFYYKIPVEKLIHPLCILNINYTISGQIYKSKFFKLLQN